jgi:hypothetical protein
LHDSCRAIFLASLRSGYWHSVSACACPADPGELRALDLSNRRVACMGRRWAA